MLRGSAWALGALGALRVLPQRVLLGDVGSSLSVWPVRRWTARTPPPEAPHAPVELSFHQRFRHLMGVFKRSPHPPRQARLQGLFDACRSKQDMRKALKALQRFNADHIPLEELSAERFAMACSRTDHWDVLLDVMAHPRVFHMFFSRNTLLDIAKNWTVSHNPSEPWANEPAITIPVYKALKQGRVCPPAEFLEALLEGLVRRGCVQEAKKFHEEFVKSKLPCVTERLPRDVHDALTSSTIAEHKGEEDGVMKEWIKVFGEVPPASEEAFDSWLKEKMDEGMVLADLSSQWSPRQRAGYRRDMCEPVPQSTTWEQMAEDIAREFGEKRAKETRRAIQARFIARRAANKRAQLRQAIVADERRRRREAMGKKRY